MNHHTRTGSAPSLPTTGRLWLCAALLLGLLGQTASGQAPTEIPSVADLARTDSLDLPKISPDGKYVAFRAWMGTTSALAVMSRDTGTFERFDVGTDRSVLNYSWASPERLVITIGEAFGRGDEPSYTGELLAVNADGTQPLYLFGARGETIKLGTRIGHNTRTNAFGELIRTLPDDPDHVLISSTVFAADMSTVKSIAMRAHTHTGVRDQKVEAPIAGAVAFVADSTGFVRYVVGSKGQQYVRSPESPSWRLLGSNASASNEPNDDTADDTNDSVLAGASQWAYLAYTPPEGRTSCLARQATSGDRPVEVIRCHPYADVADILLSDDGETAVAVLFDAGRPQYEVIEADHVWGKLQTMLNKAFPGQLVTIESSTRDGRTAVVSVSGDRNPGDFYLFDTRTKKAEYLLGYYDWLNPELMGERRPIEVRARDGQMLYGYLTLPPRRDAKGLPLVVNPHGGPFGIRDRWVWDPGYQPELQMLATRGYAVLQINFRGSGGYGTEFRNAGRKGWDSVMIDDISDAARWAIDQGFADPKRLCIMGSSYGGYAAMMSAIREPAFYRCVVSNAGVYDLVRLKRGSDIGETAAGREYINDYVGSTPETLAQASPINRLDALKVPVLMVHGTDDERAPYDAAEQVHELLEERRHPHEWLPISTESHGYYSPKNRELYLNTVLSFVERNIGPGAPAAAPAETAAAPLSATPETSPPTPGK